MEKKNRPKLPSPQERLDLILLGLARGKPVDLLCQEAGVSRELFYRWMQRVRQGALQALEAKIPGPKRVRTVEQATQRIRRMEDRLSRLEQQARSLRKERDHLTLVNREALGVIHRRAWEEPQAPAKKNAMQAKRSVRSTVRNGSRHAPRALRSDPSVQPGELIVPRTGDGSGGRPGPGGSDGGLQSQ
jgi:transposase-like protein